MDVDFYQLDESLRAEADELLWNRGVYAELEKYGRVCVNGSYKLKLMVLRILEIKAQCWLKPGH